VHVLRDNGIPVIASDIEKGNCDLHFVGDFLQRERAPEGCSAVVAQPPRQLAVQFAEHAFSLVPDVFLLLRLAFLGNVDHAGLRRVLVFRRRLPGMPIGFAWMCWRRGYTGPTIPARI
jgi:hypothetical protein